MLITAVKVYWSDVRAIRVTSQFFGSIGKSWFSHSLVRASSHSRHIKNVCFAAREMENKSTKHLLHMFRCCSLGWFWFWCLLLPTLSRGDSLSFFFFGAIMHLPHTLCDDSIAQTPASISGMRRELSINLQFSFLDSNLFDLWKQSLGWEGEISRNYWFHSARGSCTTNFSFRWKA